MKFNKKALLLVGVAIIFSLFVYYGLKATASAQQQQFPTLPKTTAATATGTTAAAAEPQEGPPKMTFFGLLVAGGPVMIPICLGSVIGLALIIELFFRIRKKNFIVPHFVEAVNAYIKRGDYNEALKLCNSYNNVLAKAFAEAIRKRDYSKADIEAVIAEKCEDGLAAVNGLNSYLSSVAVIEPMLGLLGTVTGMIRAFNVIAFQAGLGKPALLAKGVSEALITTAAGLIIAIPFFAFYYYFRGVSRNIARKLSIEATNFVDNLLTSMHRKG
jgi:biopolymer transport protein ExbB